MCEKKSQAHIDATHMLEALQQLKVSGAFSRARRTKVVMSQEQFGVEDEDNWNRSLRQRQHHELAEKRAVRQCVEEHQQVSDCP